jgi:hypothetical protein
MQWLGRTFATNISYRYSFGIVHANTLFLSKAKLHSIVSDSDPSATFSLLPAA